jgi:hypothetical protein
MRLGKWDAIRVISSVTIACLAMAMSVLLVSSFLISRDLFSFTALDGAFAVRSLHLFAAYWALFVVAIHLGTRWQVIMNVSRSALRISGSSALRSSILRLLALAIAVYGVHSSFEMSFGSKLMLVVTLDMWDFNESTPDFFLNYFSIMGLYAVLTYYILQWLRMRRRTGLAQCPQPLSWRQAHEEG